MSVMDFSEFAAHCEEQEVALHPDLAIPVVEKHVKPGFICYAPTDMLAAVTVAGALLREDASIELADRPVRLDKILVRSGLNRVLAGIINHSIEPITAESGIVELPGRGQSAEACQSADYRFMQTLLDIEDGRGSSQVIGNGEPVLLRKMGHGIRSALSLQTVGVNGIAYPPGSIFSIELTESTDTLAADPIPKGTESLDLSRVADLNFVRLSTFALSIPERLEHFAKTASSTSYGYDRVRTALRHRSMRAVTKIVEEAYEPEPALV